MERCQNVLGSVTQTVNKTVLTSSPGSPRGPTGPVTPGGPGSPCKYTNKSVSRIYLIARLHFHIKSHCSHNFPLAKQMFLPEY